MDPQIAQTAQTPGTVVNPGQVQQVNKSAGTEAAKVVSTIKSGLKTTEFYLSTLVVAVGAVVQFLPASTASSAVKIVAAISSVLSAVGYTSARSAVKVSSQK